jgi:hypothetical protein
MRALRPLPPMLAMTLALSGACASAPAAPSPPPAGQTVPGEALRAELLALGRADQADREGIAAAMAARDTAFMRRLMAGDSARTARLRAVVREHGWPSPVRVGGDAVEAAWLVLQHTPDHAWQAELLPTLEARAAAGELPRQGVALLTDRVLLHAGRPQRYGSQFSAVDGRLIPEPVEDLATLDARRAAVGLPPMAEYVEQLAEAYEMPVQWPPAR